MSGDSNRLKESGNPKFFEILEYPTLLKSCKDDPGDSIRPFGYKRLAEFVTQPNDLVITALEKNMKSFQQNVNLEDPKDDMIILLIQIIGEKICGETSFHEIQNELVAMAADINFLRKLKDFTLNMSYFTSSTTIRSTDIHVDRSQLRILNALSAFYGLLCVRTPSFAVDNLIPSIQAAHATNELLRVRKLVDEEPSQELELRLMKLLEELKESKEANEKPQEERKKKQFRGNVQLSAADIEKLYMITPEDKFWEAQIIPTAEEIISEEEPFLRPNLAKGKYPSALTYLDVQYRLLREDFVAPLRESVKEYLTHETEYSSRKKRLPPGTIRFYHDVKLRKVECLQEMTLFSMQFSTSNLKRVKWEKSKRLLNGSLLLLTPDKFGTIYFATVGRRDEKQLPKGIIDIIWEGRRPETYTNVVFLMIECEVYFESYRHTLKALQEMAQPCPPLHVQPRLETYIMTKYIVDVDKSTDQDFPPRYLRSLPTKNLRMDFKMLLKSNIESINLMEQVAKEMTGTDSILGSDSANNNDRKPIQLLSFHGNPLLPEDWPTAAQLGMDEPQYLAFRSAITQELSIIQGPPGTGKTYIGLQIMKLLLANPSVTWSKPAGDNTVLPNIDIDLDFEEEDTSLYESPILVVCYTNHALDQFLEGIISIMHSLNIDPRGNLIRVGGMSKVEVVQQYNIREINKYYTKNRLFDASYAQLRVRTRSDLVLRQNERADLKSQFRGLCHPEGIINFLNLCENCSSESLRNNLGEIFSRELNEIFLSRSPNKLINWLGLSIEDFRSEHFRATSLISKWFRMFQQKPTQIPQFAVETNPEDNQEEELEDEELQNILQAHRLQEEITMEDEKHIYKAVGLTYLLNRNSSKDFNATRMKLAREYNDAERTRNMRKLQDLQTDFWQLQLEESKFENQCKFLNEMFAAYEEERIELPEVTQDLLKRGHEKDAPLRPTMNEKWALYFYFVEQAKRMLITEVTRMEGIIIKAQEKLQQVMNSGNGKILQKAMVVGMTTTGAAKYNTLLRMMKSRIVIVEEAAEVLESHIVTSITEHCEHLILIGDHKQLKPSPTVYKLAKDYNLDLSLFERLINNNLRWQYLRAQHRMRPEISKLLVPTIYRELEDHSSVFNYPSIPGFLKNLFFVTHSEAEKADNDSMTKSNEYEAKYLTKLCRYLMLQGLKPGQVTILTTYIGQMFLIKRLLADEGNTCRGVRVTVVDNFQGEENDIILLSLVRSNDDNKIGFLKTENRICVALSRAKHGFYIVGNMDCLVKSQSKTWDQISQELEAQDSIGDCMKLKCQIHGEIIEIRCAEDFLLKSPEGGCTKMCPGVLPKCNHSCRKICHIIDRDHKEYQCKLPCDRVCIDMAKHPCPHPCFRYPCPPCESKIVRKLPCGHNCLLPCYVEYNQHKCEELVTRNLPCGHQVDLKCHYPVESFICIIRVDKSLECGHVKTLPCNVPTLEFECTEFVERMLPCSHLGRMKCVDDLEKFTCNVLCLKLLPCGHEQGVACYADSSTARCQIIITRNKPGCFHEVQIPCYLESRPETWDCKSTCDTRLNCGHQCVRNCHLEDDPQHLEYKCRKNCARTCPSGLHLCRNKHACYQDCDPCNVRCDKTLPCGHTFNLQCSVDVETVQCKKPCSRTVKCPNEHPCLKKCFEPCEPCIMEIEKQSNNCSHMVKVKCYELATRSVCQELVESLNRSACGHVVEVPCRIQNTCSSEDCRQYCHQPCGRIISTEKGGCGHPCEGDCASCHEGMIHVKCMKSCGRVLACGHICKFPCSSLCPPCEDTCILRCSHSKCKKKCGEPCNNCKERCKWSCEHFQCIKKCSELCNRDACNEPCKKKLKCEHDCIGSCGEPCPPFCRICEKEIVEEILFGDEDVDDARFVYLEDCGHVIHRENMDKWMAIDQVGKDKPKEIGVKRCPKCQTIITKSVRYGNIVKTKLREVLAVRDKIFSNAKFQKRYQNSVADKVGYVRNRNYEFENVREYLESNVFRIHKEGKKGIPRFVRELVDVDQYVFESLHNIVLWWEEAEGHVKLNPIPYPLPPMVRFDPYTRQRIQVPRQPVTVKQDLTDDCRNDLIAKYKSLFKILLSRKLPLSHQEISDFEQEFDRMHDFYRLGLRRGIEKFTTFNGAEFLFNETRKILCKNVPYDLIIRKQFDDSLQILESLLKSGWKIETEKMKAEIRANRSQIFTAMGFGGNHWYKCNQGHLYVVADCGAFNQSGQCPECRSSVGRGSSNTCVRDESLIRSQIAGVEDDFTEPPPLEFGESSERPRRGGHYARGSRRAKQTSITQLARGLKR
ncbi:unnamed protein product [Allacma fusca]|uniref:NFX1-type zinc finger-containing protein 1 n=1 Tax=Allacma fusca TaxID=39272 RepID=A0A8J2LF79_9HEXA|nr:unnamed protein product [Allacma fusca]